MHEASSQQSTLSYTATSGSKLKLECIHLSQNRSSVQFLKEKNIIFICLFSHHLAITSLIIGANGWVYAWHRPQDCKKANYKLKEKTKGHEVGRRHIGRIGGVRERLEDGNDKVTVKHL